MRSPAPRPRAPRQRGRTSIKLIAAWVAFGLFTIVVGVVIALYADRLAHLRRQAVLTDFFDHVLQLPLMFHGESHSGRLMKVMLAGTDALWVLWLDFFRNSFAAGASLVVLLPLAIYLNWPLGLMMLAVAVVFGALTALVINKTEMLQRTVERHYSDLAERASDTLGNIALVQGFARVEAEVTGLRTIADDLLAAQIPVLSWWAVIAVLTRASTTLTHARHLHRRRMAAFPRPRHHRRHRDVHEFRRHADRPAREVRALHQQGVHGRAAPARILQRPRHRIGQCAMRRTPSTPAACAAWSNSRTCRSPMTASARRWPISPSPRCPAKPSPSSAAPAPARSTALALLHRAFDPQSGEIDIDGVNIRDIKLAALRRNIGVVYQESLLLNRSVADNLRVGKADATEAEMREAATRAQALDFIERAPDTFSTPVGERGRALSGGERQRLSIARAILKDPPILILDEATSALDAETERKVQAALDEVMKNRTTFVIAHRLSTVRNATRILVFEHGRIVETGTFDELVRIGGRFAALAKAQFMTADSPAPLPRPTAQPVET